MDYIKIKRSKIHGTGVYAKSDIPKGTRVIEYVGEKLTKGVNHKIQERDWRLPDLQNYIWE